jgi:hypothetical protein
MAESGGKTIEVRGFLHLDAVFKKRKWPSPLVVELDAPISGAELAAKLEIPLEEIEVIFINGLAQSPQSSIMPGDRVAFVPPGCPGPYRICLGFYGKNEDNKFNFVKKNDDPENSAK